MMIETPEYEIAVQIEGDWAVEAEILRRAALTALRHQNIPPTEIAIVISDDETLQALNRRFRGMDSPTDVLAFPTQIKGPFAGFPGQPHYLGDIVISYPRAQAQAAEAGHPLQSELQLLVVHGLLHLLGYDDQSEPERTKMWEVQAEIMHILTPHINLPE